jgi:putative transcriptional regulator
MMASMEIAPGHLLVATPALGDPNFVRTVVLIVDIEDDGAVGVVLNRPTTLLVGEVLESWEGGVAEPPVLFEGGPVRTEAALAVGLLRDVADVPVGFHAIHGRLGLLDLDTPRELVEGSLSGLRIFAGYAGWGAEQLADEIAEGSWYVVPALREDVFRPSVETLWSDVLRRQPGELAWQSTRPADPEDN